jgi:hypothetical protein
MKAGFGKSDITPRLGVQLAGYGPYRNRAAQEIVAPLAARAIFVRQGKTTMVLLSLELCGTPRSLAERIRAVVAARVGCRADDVFLSATHTHSAPSVGGMFGWGEADAVYLETLPARAAEAAARAKAALGDVVWRHAQVACEGVAVNRETDAGFALNADFAERMNPRWRPAHPERTDATVRVLAAYGTEGEAAGKLVGLLHHFGCHPVVYGEKTAAVHGDFVGLASMQLETKHAGAVAIFLPGALGDVNPKLNHRGPRESRRALKAIARQYAGAVGRGLKAAHRTEAGEGGVTSASAEVILKRVAWSRARVMRRVAELEKIFAVEGATDFPHAGGPPPLHTRGMEMARLQGLRALLAEWRGRAAPNPPVRVHGLRIGPVVLLGCGLEVYHSLQAEILKNRPAASTWVVSLVGGNGYAPDAAAQRRAGYSDDFVPLMMGELPYARVDVELVRALAGVAGKLGAKKAAR